MKPILFNTEMVQAILEGRKTVTRRVIKPQPVMDTDGLWHWKGYQWMDGGLGIPASRFGDYLPYRPGDILYVRETWAEGTDPKIHYKADGETLPNVKWHPSIHMPRRAARIFLRVTDVGVERLQDISADGILEEGVNIEIPPICKMLIDPDFPSDRQREQWKKMTETQREEYAQNLARHMCIGLCDYAVRVFDAFKCLWDSAIKPSDRALYGWKANPWVRVITFERCEEPEEDAVMGAAKERRTSKAYWNGLIRQPEHQKDRTKARQKPNRKRKRKCSTF